MLVKILKSSTLFAGLLLTSVAVAKPAPETDAPVAAEAPVVADAPSAAAPYLRTVDDAGRRVKLEITSRTFQPRDGKGPSVTLVGVAHIADGTFYGRLQALLDSHDVVLFESVTPPGTNGAGGDTASARHESTVSALRFVGAVVAHYAAQTGAYPADLAEVKTYMHAKDSRLPHLIDRANRDAWARPFVYERNADADGFTLMSLGSDGRSGGEDEAADLRLSDLDPLDPAMFADEDNLQASLAHALDLDFQLEAIDYDRPNWRCSDMSIDQVQAAMAAAGGDFGPLQMALSGSSLPAKVMKLMLWLIKAADAVTDGTVSSIFKVVLVEILGDPTVMEAGLGQMGDGFKEVIVDQRNQVVIDDLKAIIDDEPEVKSVAIFYGAAHMVDMASRLDEQLGYDPSEETWYTAIEVDLEKANVPPRELQRMRTMIRRAMAQQMRR
ncbi:MAG: type II secretion system protein GspG [Phycisphaerales bacterium]|nr:type II secretion system protein GspG [Phycisphaerales bacterium]